MKVGYLINTHAGYVAPLKRLLVTLVEGGVACEDVLIVSGGNVLNGIPRYGRFFGFPLLEVEHNSWDYTGLIELVMDPNAKFFHEHTHFFCLQDTMEFGTQSKALIEAADPEVNATAAFGGQCNLVLYNKVWLFATRKYIWEQRNNTKLQSIESEGALWKCLADKPDQRRTFAPGTHDVVGKGTPYSEVERIKEYYAGVDIVKWKANYGQNMHALVTKP